MITKQYMVLLYLFTLWTNLCDKVLQIKGKIGFLFEVKVIKWTTYFVDTVLDTLIIRSHNRQNNWKIRKERHSNAVVFCPKRDDSRIRTDKIVGFPENPVRAHRRGTTFWRESEHGSRARAFFIRRKITFFPHSSSRRSSVRPGREQSAVVIKRQNDTQPHALILQRTAARSPAGIVQIMRGEP